MKRIIYILSILGVIAVVILIGYFLRYKAGAPQEITPGTTTGNLPQTPTQSVPGQGNGQVTTGGATGGQPQTSAGQKFGIVAQNEAVSFFVDKENNAFLVQPDGQIVEITSGNPVVLSSSQITNLISASFSYDGKKILAVFGSGSGPQASVFDVAGKSWQPFSQDVRSPAWSPTNYKIAYLSDGGNYQAINSLDISVTNAKPVELIRLQAKDVSLNWLSINKILILDKSSAFFAGSIWSLDIKNKTFSLFAGGNPGLASLWSNDASMGLLFSASSVGRGGALRLMDTNGNSLQSLAFLTLPSKCAFNVASSTLASGSATTTKSSASAAVQKTLYCAIPRGAAGFAGKILPDDYDKKAVFTSDDFYSVNLTNGDIGTLFADQSQNIDASYLKVFNNTLFFINRFDKKIYAVSL